MRCLKRNMTAFWYCLYESSEDQYDEYGNLLPEPLVTYAEPVQMMANISAATGQAQTEMFGGLDSYDKVIVTADMSCPIDENTVLFVDKEPEFGPLPPEPPDPPTPDPVDPDDTDDGDQTDGNDTDDTDQTDTDTDGDYSGDGDDPEPEPEPEPEPHGPPLYDYIVKRVAKSLNSISIAVRKVDVG